MVGLVFDDVRRIVLALLFVVAFGWMAAHVLPGGDGFGDPQWQQLAHSGEVVPPQP